jgi:hypothetical protein
MFVALRHGNKPTKIPYCKREGESGVTTVLELSFRIGLQPRGGRSGEGVVANRVSTRRRASRRVGTGMSPHLPFGRDAAGGGDFDIRRRRPTTGRRQRSQTFRHAGTENDVGAFNGVDPGHGRARPMGRSAA